MNFVFCWPCPLPEWRAYWGNYTGRYVGITLGRLHIEVNWQR